MAGDPFKHVSSGQPLSISATGWNAAMSAARHIQIAGLSRGGSVDRFHRDPSFVWIRNDSDSDILSYAVLGIDGVVFDYDDSADEFLSHKVVLKGVKPALPDHKHNYAIPIEIIPQDHIGRAIISGAVQVQIEIESLDHRNALVEDSNGSSLVSTSGSGIPIIFRPEKLGQQWCVIRAGGLASDGGIYLGISTTALGAADWTANPPELGTGTVQPYDLDSAPDLSCPAGGTTETWYNVAPSEIASGAVLVAAEWQGIKIVIVESCETVSPGC